MGSSIIDTDLSLEDDEEDFTEEDTIGAAGGSVRVGGSTTRSRMGRKSGGKSGGYSSSSRRIQTLEEEDDQMSFSGIVVSTGSKNGTSIKSGTTNRHGSKTSLLTASNDTASELKADEQNQLLNAIMDMKLCMEQSLRDIREQNRRDFERGEYGFIIFVYLLCAII